MLSPNSPTVVTKGSFYDVSVQYFLHLLRKYLSYIWKISINLSEKRMCGTALLHTCGTRKTIWNVFIKNSKCARHISKQFRKWWKLSQWCFVLALLRSSYWILNVSFSYEVIRNMYCWEGVAISVYFFALMVKCIRISCPDYSYSPFSLPKARYFIV